MSDFIKDFEFHLKALQLSSFTIDSYVRTVKFFDKNVGNILGLSTEDIESQLNSLGDASKNQNLHALKKFYLFCLERRLIQKSPVKKIKHKNIEKSVPCFMSRDEIKMLFNMLDKEIGRSMQTNKQYVEAVRNKAMISLQYSCALRAGEPSTIKIDDIDWDENIIYINNGKGQERTAPMNSKTIDSLSYWVELRSHYAKDDHLFIALGKNHCGRGLSRGGYAQIVRAKLIESGLDEYCPHNLRHSSASHLLQNGLPIHQVSKLLGHSSVNTTIEFYAHVPRDDLQLIDAIENLI